MSDYSHGHLNLNWESRWDFSEMFTWDSRPDICLVYLSCQVWHHNLLLVAVWVFVLVAFCFCNDYIPTEANGRNVSLFYVLFVLRNEGVDFI